MINKHNARLDVQLQAFTVKQCFTTVQKTVLMCPVEYSTFNYLKSNHEPH